MSKLQHIPGADIIRILARQQFPTSEHSFRESIINGFDEGSLKVEIVIDKATGFISLEDWGGGISNIDKFLIYGQNLKEDYDHINREIVGQKGLGKLSLLRLQDRVTFVSNCGTENDLRLEMTPDGYDRKDGYTGQFLPHRGTKVIIEDAFKDEIPDVPHLKEYLSDIFSLRIKMGAEILIKESIDAIAEPLTPGKTIDPKEQHLFSLSGAQKITGNIVPEYEAKNRKLGWVSVFCKHVFVENIEVDPRDTRMFIGWINDNNLTLTIGRDQIIVNKEYMDLMKHLKQYTKKYKQLIVDPNELTHSEKTLTQQCENIMKDYFREMKISIDHLRSTHEFMFVDTAKSGEEETGTIVDGPGPRCVDGPIGTIDSNGGTRHGIVKTDKIKKSRRVPGLEWRFAKSGNVKDPIYFIAPNICVMNTTNDIYRLCNLQNTGSYLGPMWYRAAPFLGRVMTKMNPESKSYTIDKMLEEIDKATRWIMRRNKIARSVIGGKDD